MDTVKQNAFTWDWGLKTMLVFFYYASGIYLIGLLVIHEKVQS